MSIVDRAALESSPLADLHAMASELSIDGYRRLRRPELIDAILARQEGTESSSPESPSPEEPEQTPDEELPDALIDAIRTVARGDALLSPSATRGLIARFLRLHDSEPVRASQLLAALTDREREVTTLVADGLAVPVAGGYTLP